MVFGETMTLTEFNAQPVSDAASLLQQCNAATQWYEAMAAARPFASVAEMKQRAETIWAALSETDYLQAFEAHPMIGDVDSLRKKYADTKAMASGEQSGAANANEAVLAELAKLNHEYLAKFGFIFIVFATGKTAAQMLELLKARLPNSRTDEIANAAAEQLKITLLRIDKLLAQ
jgi:2-oxo-4-hydroxy-4-carboxy-5-ureidoimidazoline decarboxylase